MPSTARRSVHPSTLYNRLVLGHRDTKYKGAQRIHRNPLPPKPFDGSHRLERQTWFGLGAGWEPGARAAAAPCSLRRGLDAGRRRRRCPRAGLAPRVGGGAGGCAGSGRAGADAAGVRVGIAARQLAVVCVVHGGPAVALARRRLFKLTGAGSDGCSHGAVLHPGLHRSHTSMCYSRVLHQNRITRRPRAARTCCPVLEQRVALGQSGEEKS